MEFTGGPLAAPVFMFAMGIGMVYTRHNSPAEFAKRGIRLLVIAYLLNFFRYVVPYLVYGITSDVFIWGMMLDTYAGGAVWVFTEDGLSASLVIPAGAVIMLASVLLTIAWNHIKEYYTEMRMTKQTA